MNITWQRKDQVFTWWRSVQCRSVTCDRCSGFALFKYNISAWPGQPTSFITSECTLSEVFGLVGATMSFVIRNWPWHWCPHFAEGPCLVHTITGDLLRALEGPENCLFPRLISVSSEGHCIIYYERGRFSNFSINGKLLAQMEINDSTRVNLHTSC